jgi:DNA-binding transcriptional MerR regulator
MTVRETYRTGELARAAGVSADTIRYYERMGVLSTAPRGRNGYRCFPRAAVQRIVVIRRALEAGFSLADLRRVLRIRDAGGVPCRQVYAIAEQRLRELEDRIRDLQALRNELAGALGEWRAALASTPTGTRAGLLDSWASRVSGTPPRGRSLNSAEVAASRRIR